MSNEIDIKIHNAINEINQQQENIVDTKENGVTDRVPKFRFCPDFFEESRVVA